MKSKIFTLVWAAAFITGICEVRLMINENCPCKKKKCERHGKCDKCRKHHAESKRHRPVYCEKDIKGLNKLFVRQISV